jgi:hypothetical protein
VTDCGRRTPIQTSGPSGSIPRQLLLQTVVKLLAVCRSTWLNRLAGPKEGLRIFLQRRNTEQRQQVDSGPSVLTPDQRTSPHLNEEGICLPPLLAAWKHFKTSWVSGEGSKGRSCPAARVGLWYTRVLWRGHVHRLLSTYFRTERILPNRNCSGRGTMV